MEHKPTLPNAISSLVLGICSIMSSFVCVGLILGIIGIAISGTGNRIYRDNPNEWSGYNMLSAGRVLSIVGVIFSAIGILAVVGIAIFAGPSGCAGFYNIVYELCD